jgi:transposase-like protein
MKPLNKAATSRLLAESSGEVAKNTTGSEPLTLDDLPPPNTRRWVMRRKAEVVAGVRSGLLTVEEACQRYDLSREEFNSWQQNIDRHGVQALRVTRLQDYRRRPD